MPIVWTVLGNGFALAMSGTRRSPFLLDRKPRTTHRSHHRRASTRIHTRTFTGKRASRRSSESLALSVCHVLEYKFIEEMDLCVQYGSGVDVWPMLMDPGDHAIDSAHPHLVLSKEVLIAGNYKLIVAQPFFKSQNNGWKHKNGSWSSDNGGLPVEDCTFQTLSPAKSFFPVPHNNTMQPCLFDIRKDQR